jgi:hypothetical protein
MWRTCKRCAFKKSAQNQTESAQNQIRIKQKSTGDCSLIFDKKIETDFDTILITPSIHVRIPIRYPTDH